MNDLLAVGLHSMQQDMARLERISMNIANATTPGYKREVVSALPVQAGSFLHAMQAVDAVLPVPSVGVPANAGLLLVRTDDRPGTPKATGQSLDVALGGDGYFEISTETGRAYTRQGHWQLDARGRLVTPQGHPVMGEGGEIVLAHSNPRITATGQVFDEVADGRTDAIPVAQLKVVRFDDASELQRIGDGLVISAQAPTPVADVEVRQGFLENSNVNSMQEMAQLIQSMRHFESMQKVVLGYDEMIGSAIRKLGESP